MEVEIELKCRSASRNLARSVTPLTVALTVAQLLRYRSCDTSDSDSPGQVLGWTLAVTYVLTMTYRTLNMTAAASAKCWHDNC